MNGTIKIWEDEFATMTPEQQAYIRTLGKAWREAADLRQVVAEQDAKIAEQEAMLMNFSRQLTERFGEIKMKAALLQRYDTAMKAQAFQLGTQDRELMQLRSRVKAAEAGDLATLRQLADFQRSEIMRLKAALAERETVKKRPAMVANITVDPDVIHQAIDTAADRILESLEAAFTEEAEDATDDQRFIWEAERATLEAKIAEKEAYINRLLSRIVNTEAARDERAGYADRVLESLKKSEAAAKALQNDVDRLKGIADHSNNLAQNRLEELAKLRRELAVARDATAKLEAKVAELQEAATWRAVSRVE